MKKVDICFVILHYKTMQDTEKCIKSIERLSNKNNEIVIVDNGSGNGTGEILNEKYKAVDNVHILLLSENIGFSKGNNYGYSYARTNFIFDFMVVCNSDVFFLQDNMYDKLLSTYKNNHFFILGPDIYVPREDFHSNPLEYEILDKQGLSKVLQKKEHEKEHILWYCIHKKLKSVEHSIKKVIKKIIKYQKKVPLYNENVVLQGSCYIISSQFTKQEKLLFYPMDSFYYEEYFLYRKCLKLRYKSVFDPDIKVVHMSGSSTSADYSTLKHRSIFVLDNQIKSLSEYIKSGDLY